MDSRLDCLRRKLANSDCDGLLVSRNADVRWLTGFAGSFSMAFVTTDEAILITDTRYEEAAAEQAPGLRIEIARGERKPKVVIGELVAELGLKRLGFQPEFATFQDFADWGEQLGEGARIVPIKEAVGPCRAIKSADEIALIERACGITDRLFEHIRDWIRPDMTETGVVKEILRFYESEGAGEAFDTIVVSGERSSRPHGTPTESRLSPGFLTIDTGAHKDGYNADVTRTFVVGEPTKRYIEVYDQVLKTLDESIEMLKPGADGKDIDLRARAILDERDLSQYFGHGLGHGLGQEVHDFGRLSFSTNQPIEAGQVWTVEPGVYIPGFGGCRIEDDIVVTDGEPRNLTGFTKELVVIS